MNIEELKLVLATVATVTDDAKTVAIWYIVASYGLPFIANCLIGFAIYGVARMLFSAVASSSEWSQHGRNVAKAWGGEGSVYSYDRDSIWIARAINASKERK